MTMIARENIIESTPNLVNEIFQGVVNGSKILPLMTRLPDMTKSKESLPVLSLLPEAYWVSGDNGLKGTTKMAWDKKYIYAEEIAVVVPIPESVLADSDYDIIGQAKPRIIEAFYKKIDEAIINGKDKPARFREGLITSIINAGSAVAPSTDNLYTQISNAMGKVEEDGFDVNGIIGGVGLKKAFRDGFVDQNGQPLQASEVTEIARSFVNNGAWDNTLAKLIVGDFSQAVYAIRSDIEFKLFDSGVVTDSSGNIIYNLMQQDMVALRATLRMGWELPNPVNAENTDEETRFPFALVEPSSAPTTYNVTFTITDTQSTPAPISGVKVVLGGQTKKTNASGQAVFKSLGSADYAYVASKEGLKTDSGVVTVATANKSVAITMVAE